MLEQEQVKYVFGPFLTNVYKGIEPYAKGFNGRFLLMAINHMEKQSGRSLAVG